MQCAHIQQDVEDNCCMVRDTYCVIEGAVGRRLVWGHLVAHCYAIFLCSLGVEIKYTVATLYMGWGGAQQLSKT